MINILNTRKSGYLHGRNSAYLVLCKFKKGAPDHSGTPQNQTQQLPYKMDK